MMRICICGGGSLGHVCAAVFASEGAAEVSILTNRPERWTSHVEVADLYDKKYSATIRQASSDPAVVVADADMVFLCQPGFLIERTLAQIAPYLGENTKVGAVVSSTGFFFAAHRILPPTVQLFGFQRTPFIARVNEYGKSASLLGYKPQAYVAMENIEDRAAFCGELEKLFRTPMVCLNNFYEASLTNSNPILHTGRLYSMWNGWNGRVYDHPIKFYKEWDNEASELLIRMDAEFMNLVAVLPIAEGTILPLLTYYESTDAESLTRKIRSIAAFQTIVAPMKEQDGGWVPDFGSRYFTEDFPFGLRFIKELAEKHNISTPVIDKVFAWGMERIEKHNL